MTGALVSPLCYGQGKVTHAERWAEENDIDLATSTFYTDSLSDLPMLERVGAKVTSNHRCTTVSVRELARN